jgi:hypothetical protein
MGFRAGWVVGVMLLSNAASAQDGLRSASLPDRTPQNPIPMTATTPGVRSGSLPDRNPQNPIPPARADQFIAHRRTYTPRLPGEPPRRGRSQNFLFGGYNYGYYSNDVMPRQGAQEQIPTGFFHLQLQPGSAQVYIDGLYLGTVDDFRRLIPGRALDAGPHRVELRANGYEAAAFDVLIQPNETTTYRSDLQPTGVRARAATATSGTPKTFYVIPGCYAGDKPPRSGPLPRGCDRSKLRTVPPSVSTITSAHP